MNVTMVVSFLILLLVLVFNYAQAQSNTDYAKSFYIYGGGGPGGKSYAGMLEANIQVSTKGMLSIGTTGASDVVLILVPENSVSVNSTYVGFGRIEKGDMGFFRWSAGISFSHVERTGNYLSLLGIDNNPSKKDVVGIHLEVQCLAAKGIAGIGITPFVDINSEFTYGGLTIGIALGKVHYRK